MMVFYVLIKRLFYLWHHLENNTQIQFESSKQITLYEANQQQAKQSKQAKWVMGGRKEERRTTLKYTLQSLNHSIASFQANTLRMMMMRLCFCSIQFGVDILPLCTNRYLPMDMAGYDCTQPKSLCLLIAFIKCNYCYTHTRLVIYLIYK